MLNTHEAWPQVKTEFTKALALRSEIRRAGSPERVPALATELVALRPSVIMVAVNPVIQNAQQLPKLATNSNSFECQSTSRPDTKAGGSAGLEPPRRTW